MMAEYKNRVRQHEFGQTGYKARQHSNRVDMLRSETTDASRADESAANKSRQKPLSGPLEPQNGSKQTRASTDAAAVAARRSTMKARVLPSSKAGPHAPLSIAQLPQIIIVQPR